MIISVLQEVKLGFVRPRCLRPLAVYITFLLGDEGGYVNKQAVDANGNAIMDANGNALMIVNPKVDDQYLAELQDLRRRIRTWYLS
jgi:hypothetical protein